jgi:ABC-2 type transport system permease protein
MNSPVAKTPRAAFRKLLLNETRLVFRPPLALLAGLGVPILLLVIFGSIPAITKVSKSLDGLSYFTSSFPILIGITVLMLGAIFLPRVLVAYREQGILRRLSTTPVPPAWLLAAQVILNSCLAIIGIIILTAVGIAVFGLSSPKDLIGYILICLLTITSLFSIGLCIAAVAKTNGVANVMAGLLFYLMLFTGGLWIPLQIMPRVLRDICIWTPLGAAVSGTQNAMQGHFPAAQSLLCLVGYTLAFAYLSVRYFRWE